MALWQKTVAPFSEHKGGVGPFLEIPRSNSDCVRECYLDCSNYDPGLTLTCFMLRSNLVT